MFTAARLAVLLCALGAAAASLSCSDERYPNVADADRHSCAQCPPGRGGWNTSLCRACTPGQFGGGNGTCTGCPVAQYSVAEARTCKACADLPKCGPAKSRQCDPDFVGLCIRASAGNTDPASHIEEKCGNLFLDTESYIESGLGRDARLCRANETKYAAECERADCGVNVQKFLRLDHHAYGSVIAFITLWCVFAVFVPVVSDVLSGGGDPRGKGKPAQWLRFALNTIDIACFYATWWVRAMLAHSPSVSDCCLFCPILPVGCSYGLWYMDQFFRVPIAILKEAERAGTL